MDLGKYADGRAINYDQQSGMLDVGGTTVTPQQLREYDDAGQVTWAAEGNRAWLDTSFPAVAAIGGPAKSMKTLALAVVIGTLLLCGMCALVAILMPDSTPPAPAPAAQEGPSAPAAEVPEEPAVVEDVEPPSTAQLKSTSTSWDYTRSDGYSYTLEFTIWEPIPGDASGSIVHPGDSSATLDSFPDYDPSKDLAIPFQLRAKNTTPDFSLDELRYGVEFFAVNGDDSSQGTDPSRVFLDYLRFDGGMTEQWAVDSSGSGPVMLSRWKTADPALWNWTTVAPGATASQSAFIILSDYYTPATPSGPIGLLDNVGLEPDFVAIGDWEAKGKDSARGLTFSGKVIAGGQ